MYVVRATLLLTVIRTSTSFFTKIKMIRDDVACFSCLLQTQHTTQSDSSSGGAFIMAFLPWVQRLSWSSKHHTPPPPIKQGNSHVYHPHNTSPSLHFFIISHHATSSCLAYRDDPPIDGPRTSFIITIFLPCHSFALCALLIVPFSFHFPISPAIQSYPQIFIDQSHTAAWLLMMLLIAPTIGC